ENLIVSPLLARATSCGSEPGPLAWSLTTVRLLRSVRASSSDASGRKLVRARRAFRPARGGRVVEEWIGNNLIAVLLVRRIQELGREALGTRRFLERANSGNPSQDRVPRSSSGRAFHWSACGVRSGRRTLPGLRVRNAKQGRIRMESLGHRQAGNST